MRHHLTAFDTGHAAAKDPRAKYHDCPYSDRDSRHDWILGFYKCRTASAQKKPPESAQIGHLVTA